MRILLFLLLGLIGFTAALVSLANNEPTTMKALAWTQNFFGAAPDRLLEEPCAAAYNPTNEEKGAFAACTVGFYQGADKGPEGCSNVLDPWACENGQALRTSYNMLTQAGAPQVTRDVALTYLAETRRFTPHHEEEKP